MTADHVPPAEPARGGPRQPYLHDLVGVLAAPTQYWSAPDADLRRDQIGLVHADVRLVAASRLTVSGMAPVLLRTASTGATLRTVSVVRALPDDQPDGQTDSPPDGPDPAIRLDRVREVTPHRVTETITVTSFLDREVCADVSLVIEPDAAPMDLVKAGRDEPADLDVRMDGSSVRWGGSGVEARLEAPTASVTTDPTGVRIAQACQLTGRGTASLTVVLDLVDTDGPVVAGVGQTDVGSASTAFGGDRADRTDWADRLARDPRLLPWLTRSLADLDGLRMARRDHRDDTFLAAGAPWYLTLFGRDSLWAARLLLPVDRDLAGGTLRTLARLQGRVSDPATEEAPGKILHELRRAGVTSLPPVYYGTIDATCLWVVLLHEAWRAGLPDNEVEALLPQLTAALGWIRDSGDPDGDGFLEYQDSTGRGLANQGWKDSADSIRFSDGTIAEGPVALCEAQAYAYQSLTAGADLLATFDAGPADPWRELAAALADRFRARFWSDRTGLPALALDGRKQQVDTVTSNLGHLLGTGMLRPDEERLVADRLVADDLRSGLGLRTMSADEGGYHPISYHCGSVWPHDTAIAIRGLLVAGFDEHARRLADELAVASVVFGQRLPELWSGEGPIGVPYPASCRPQAWSAAAVVPAVEALVGPFPTKPA